MAEDRRRKKIAAALAAALQHIAECESPVGPVAPAAADSGVRSYGPWALAGRQDAMAYRVLWQRRLAKSW